VIPTPHPLRGRVALVTGAARRVGRTIVLALAEAGADVVIHHRSRPDAAETLATEVRAAGRRALVLAADLADAGTASALVASLAAQWGRLDLLVANASVYEPSPIDTLGAAALDRHFAVNARAPVLLTIASLPLLRAQGEGRVVFIGDAAGERPLRHHLAHSMSKAALHCAVRGLARELAPLVSVNAVLPGVVLRPDDPDEVGLSAALARVPARRLGRPEDVASAVLFFATASTFVTGTLLPVDGGRLTVL